MVPGYVDLHIHIGAFETVPVYGRGPDAREPLHPSYLHALRPTLTAKELEQADATVFVSLAYANPFTTFAESRASMRARMLRQIRAVAEFCEKHPEHWVWARNPEQARIAIAAGKKVVVQGMEGATKVMDSEEDVAFWKEEGVVVVTPVHLSDNELGGSWCMSGSYSWFNLPGCRLERREPEAHGLTELGKEMAARMMEAGMVMDLAHASPQTFEDLIGIIAKEGAAPIISHVSARAIRDVPEATSDLQLAGIYGLKGLVGVTANLHNLLPTVKSPGCPGTIDDFRLHWDHVVQMAAGAPVGWGSDFQGATDHLRPKYGKKGCEEHRPDGAPLSDFDRLGLAHVGLTPSLFQQLDQGSDRGPLDRSAERFLQIWELARKERQQISE